MQYRGFDIIQLGSQLFIYNMGNQLVHVTKTMTEAKQYIDRMYLRAVSNL